MDDLRRRFPLPPVPGKRKYSAVRAQFPADKSEPWIDCSVGRHFYMATFDEFAPGVPVFQCDCNARSYEYGRDQIRTHAPLKPVILPVLAEAITIDPAFQAQMDDLLR